MLPHRLSFEGLWGFFGIRIQIWVYRCVGFPLRKASPRGEAPAKRVMRWYTWVNFHYRAKEKRRCGGYTSSVGCAATFPSRGRLTRRPNSPKNCNLPTHNNPLTPQTRAWTNTDPPYPGAAPPRSSPRSRAAPPHQ